MLRRLSPDVVHDQDLLKLPPTATVRTAARQMQRRHVGAVLVTDEGDRLCGIFTERDVVHRVVAAGRDPDRTRLAAVMTANPSPISPDATALEALRQMHDGGYRHLPIVKDDRLVGIVSRRDFYGLEKARINEEEELWQRI
jgi:CBS domain-containing protein